MSYRISRGRRDGAANQDSVRSNRPEARLAEPSGANSAVMETPILEVGHRRRAALTYRDPHLTQSLYVWPYHRAAHTFISLT